MIPDDGPATVDPLKVKRVIFCTGKVYYELIRERKTRGVEDAVAVVRIEQVTPALSCVHSVHGIRLEDAPAVAFSTDAFPGKLLKFHEPCRLFRVPAALSIPLRSGEG